LLSIACVTESHLCLLPQLKYNATRSVMLPNITACCHLVHDGKVEASSPCVSLEKLQPSDAWYSALAKERDILREELEKVKQKCNRKAVRLRESVARRHKLEVWHSLCL
jgi:hypothetical protein